MTALIVRKADHVYRGKCATLNEANAQGRMGWPIDMNTLWLIKQKGCRYILTFNSTNGDLWIARPEDWENTEKLVDGDVIKTNYRGEVIRHLSVEHMLKLDGAIDLKTGRR